MLQEVKWEVIELCFVVGGISTSVLGLNVPLFFLYSFACLVKGLILWC